jgi:hypothetical protein
MSESEIARLCGQIELDCQASWMALHGLASGSAQHAFITTRLRHMDTCHQLLRGLIGEEQATEVVSEVFNRVAEEFVPQTPVDSPFCSDEAARRLTPKNILHKIILTQEDM